MPAKRTSKIAGRFGPRYGSSLRKKWSEIMEKKDIRIILALCVKQLEKSIE